jgi:hypothetical protein
MSDIESLKDETGALTHEVSALKQQVDIMVMDISGRVGTLENRVGTIETRVNRLDALLLDMQLDIRGIHKSILALQASTAHGIEELRDMVKRLLENSGK